MEGGRKGWRYLASSCRMRLTTSDTRTPYRTRSRWEGSRGVNGLGERWPSRKGKKKIRMYGRNARVNKADINKSE